VILTNQACVGWSCTITFPILTVSDRPDFAKRGGMVEFYTHKNKVLFFINLFAVKEATLAMNANLLRVANVIE